jgi:hypothetical protein
VLGNAVAGEVVEKLGTRLGCDKFHVLVWKTGFSSHTVHNMVDPQLLEAYRRTSFIIEAPHCEINLRVGEPSQAIDALLESYHATTCAFITAWNPGSVRLEASYNKQLQAELVQIVQSLRLPFLPGRGVGESTDWPPEESILVIGVDQDGALKIGRTFGQLAIVFKKIHQPVELLLCGR